MRALAGFSGKALTIWPGLSAISAGMDRMKALLLDFAADSHGATAIEYGLVASLISMTIIIWAQQIGQSVLGFFESVQAGFN